MIKSFFLLFILINYSFASDCHITNREQFLKINQEMYREYTSLDSTVSMDPLKEAVWIEGDPKVNKAIFLVHGYMGTPREMLYLTKPLRVQGFSVIGFLIPGHGFTTKVSNHFKADRWKQEIKTQLELVTNCFSEVRAVGFSTGGLLLHDYLISNSTPKSLKSLHLISPYFLPRLGIVLEGLIEAVFNDISVDTAYFFTRFPDLKVMTIDRDYYNQNIPLGTAREIKRLGESVYQKDPVIEKLKIPVQLFISEHDWTADIKTARTLVEKNYQNVQTFLYKSELKEPHHLMSPSVSRVASELQAKITTP